MHGKDNCFTAAYVYFKRFDTEIGKEETEKADFDYLEKKVPEWGEPKFPSAKQARTLQVQLRELCSVFTCWYIKYTLNGLLFKSSILNIRLDLVDM
uniref:Uncharacterized protein n=1 Tax=Daucus carota subsp. sativus TaxID=79200 RepID=A0A165X8F4_DAUCS